MRSEWVKRGKDSELDFHFQETCYKDNPIYQDSYLDTCRDNWQLGRLKEDKIKKTSTKDN